VRPASKRKSRKIDCANSEPKMVRGLLNKCVNVYVCKCICVYMYSVYSWVPASKVCVRKRIFVYIYIYIQRVKKGMGLLFWGGAKYPYARSTLMHAQPYTRMYLFHSVHSQKYTRMYLFHSVHSQPYTHRALFHYVMLFWQPPSVASSRGGSTPLGGWEPSVASSRGGSTPLPS